MNALGGRVVIPRPWRRSVRWLPVLARPGRVFQGPGGELIRVADDGASLDWIIQGGRPHAGIAADPSAGRAP